MANFTSRRAFFVGVTAIAAAAAMGPVHHAAYAQDSDALRASFRTPPASARPRVWWHWMNGNVSMDGVRADFQWMTRAGIGGVQNFDASLRTPQIVDHRIAYLTDEWRHMFRQTVALADQMGLEFAIAGSPGWSQTGGPWVRPEQAMKKLVWSETTLEGGRRFNEALPAPPDAVGPYGAIAEEQGGGFSAAQMPHAPNFYRDQIVIAYRTPEQDGSLNAEATITSSAGEIDGARLSNGDYDEPVTVPYGDDSATSTWIQFAFDAPRTVRALTVFFAGGESRFAEASNEVGWVEVSDDGVSFERVAVLPGTNQIPRTVAFPATTGRFFRVQVRIDPDATVGGGFGRRGVPRTAHDLLHLELFAGARVHFFEDKAGFWDEPRLKELGPVDVDASALIVRGDVMDITAHMSADGVLDWTPPEGRWTVLRMGYSLTGETNGPASTEGTGLEVDKLNREHVRAYVKNYLGVYEATLGEGLMGGRGLGYLVTDSYEAGATNWTNGMPEKFAALRGYELLPWLPVLAGRVVGSAAESERFLWDYRRTLGDLMAEEHYGEITRALRERGMGRYGESHEDRRAFVGDGMQVKKSADIPMGATWMPEVDFPHASPSMRDADIRESASVAHIYGKTFVAAESLTARGTRDNTYGYAPRHLKPVADRMMASGLNRFVIHASVHQPKDDPGPGVGLGPFGQWFTRKETWAAQADAWTGYLARSCHMLQQGRFVADIAYFYGEDDNVTVMYIQAPPPIPDGYNYDFVNGDALINDLTPGAGVIVAPSGVTYRALAIDPTVTRMTLPALRKLRDFAAAGVPVIGAKPEMTPSLADDPDEFTRLADELWSRTAITASLEEAMHRIVPPDFAYTRPNPDTELLFVHRALEDGEVYFVNSRSAEAQEVEASFRVVGKAPEIWWAHTGTVEELAFRVEDGRTVVPLRLAPHDAFFVVFRTDTTATRRALPPVAQTTVATLDGGWRVTFPLLNGEERVLSLDELASWSEEDDPEIRYFSGTATYARDVEMAPSPGVRLVLQLGDVRELAEVVVNGESAGVAWKDPFDMEITDLVTHGRNRIEIKVVNLWPNRLIGDRQPGAAPQAFAVYDPYTADSPLRVSGLLGPARVVARKRGE